MPEQLEKIFETIPSPYRTIIGEITFSALFHAVEEAL